jgi:glycosyltransferase involved in cell wall biosynthesis
MGYVGRFHTLEMEKGIPELIQAIAYLPSLGGKEPLLLCVGGPMDAVPAYLALARRYGVPESRLRFIDRVPNREVPFWIRAFDISAAPFPNSEHYAYFMSPLKLFEYMMAGVPIIASDLPSVREVLRHGNNAWLVEPGSSSSLRQGIELLVVNSSLGAKLAEQAKADVRNYAWVDRASRILQRLGGIRNAS